MKENFFEIHDLLSCEQGNPVWVNSNNIYIKYFFDFSSPFSAEFSQEFT